MSGPETSGIVFGIQRFSVDDGPGIRTTVFLKGCPLRCRWCHNPEGLDPRPVVSLNAARCIGCGACERECPKKAHHRDIFRHTIDREYCDACGRCAAACPGGALEMVGERMTAGEVVDAAERDRRYYGEEGGITASGGEPLLQFDFLIAILAEAKARGLGTAVETSGFGPVANYLRLLPLVDLFLWDCKETDDGRHRELIGVGCDEIIASLKTLDEAGGRFLLRCPVVPGVNDRPDHFAAVRRLAASCRGVESVQIMPYHRLGTGKAERFGFTRGAEYEQPDEATVDMWRRAAGCVE